ncbi:hypothetical protein LSAT2_006942 [Lamellibrachia satsuma]|nr:hypothetical protein LSAT2_006942 [Lamellibrachia satsuma]
MVNFISDIGGILGLWVGCSIISIFEFVELFVDLTMLGVFGLLGRRDDRKTAPQDDNDIDVDNNANGGCSERKNSYTYTTPPPTYRSLQHSELTRRQQPEWQKVMAQANL